MRCEKCGHQNEDNALLCVNCGYPLKEADYEEAEIQEILQPETEHAALKAEAVHAVPVHLSPERKKNKKKPVIPILLFSFFLLGVTVFCVYYFKIKSLERLGFSALDSISYEATNAEYYYYFNSQEDYISISVGLKEKPLTSFTYSPKTNRINYKTYNPATGRYEYVLLKYDTKEVLSNNWMDDDPEEYYEIITTANLFQSDFENYLKSKSSSLTMKEFIEYN